jgi:hypothetical protein
MRTAASAADFPGPRASADLLEIARLRSALAETALDGGANRAQTIVADQPADPGRVLERRAHEALVQRAGGDQLRQLQRRDVEGVVAAAGLRPAHGLQLGIERGQAVLANGVVAGGDRRRSP